MPKASNTCNDADSLSSFGISKAAFEAIPGFLKTSASTLLIVALLIFSIGALLASVLLVRLGLDALLTADQTYQEAAKNFLFALAGAFTAPFLVWRAWVAHLQASAATAQANVALENHLTGLFAKSVELLGTARDVAVINPDGTSTIRSLPNLESRLGALYALERLLRESAKDQQAILETICAYVRENAPLQDASPDSQIDSSKSSLAPSCRNDVQAALTIVGRRPLPIQIRGQQENWVLDLRNANLSGSDLSGLNFDRSNFSGSTLTRANLSGSSFWGSTFSKTSFICADLSYASFSQSWINHCDFKKAKIHDTNLSQTTIESANFLDADVTSVSIEGANLEKLFSYSLEFAVESILKSGPNHFNAIEVLKTAEFFGKARRNDLTTLSSAAIQAILLVEQDARSRSS